MQADYRYIVVEGPIGSGKSPLSRKLAEHFGCTLISEQPEQNPFLEQFYLNAANHGLAAELYFLLRRTETLNLIAAADEIGNANHSMQRVVSDFLLEKDQIFVPVVLDDDENANEQTLFWEAKHRIMPEMPVPDLVIYLQTADEAADKRLISRGGGTFNLFPAGYLGRIRDFTGNDDHFELLLRPISHMQGNRHYLNLKDI